MLASEKASGCKLDLDLSSASKVISQRGTINGAIPKDGGFYFDGTNDYIQYILGSEFYSDAISYVMEFTPEFNWDENQIRCLFDTTDDIGSATKRFAIYKYDLAVNYALYCVQGNTHYVIDYTLYSPYWKQNRKNTIVVSSTGTNLTIYFNGVKIINNVVSGFTRLIRINRIFIGSLRTGAGNFKGLIHSFKIYNRALSDQECLDYCNNATFLYGQRATVILPMRLQDHDPTNLRTLDVSGHGYHATFGDGVTPGTYPTKITGKRGYSFYGGRYLSFPASLNGVFTGVFQNPFTLIMFTKGHIGFSFNKGMLGVSWFKIFLTAPIKYTQFKGSDTINYFSGFISENTPGFDYMKIIQVINKINAGSIGSMKYYINNSDRLQSYFDGSNTFIENNEQALIGYQMLGEYYYFALYPFSLTQIQMTDVYLKLLQDINHE